MPYKTVLRRTPDNSMLSSQVPEAGFLRHGMDVGGCFAGGEISISNRFMVYGTKRLQKTETLIRHEIGHLFGLTDVIDFTTLMNREVDEDVQHPVNISDMEREGLRCLLDPKCDATKLKWEDHLVF